jgi:hypothetical protein
MKRRTRLHLIHPADAGPVALRALRILLADPDPPFSDAVLLLAGSADERRAARLGVHTTDRIIPPAGAISRCAPPLRRYLRERGRPDVIHAWSPDAARLAADVAPAAPRVLSPMRPPADGLTPIRRPVAPRTGPIADVSLGPPEINAAWRLAAPTPLAFRHIPIPPPLPADLAPTPHNRDAARARISADAESLVVALVGDPSSRLDAYTFTVSLVVMAKAGMPVLGLVPSDAFALLRARRWLRPLIDAPRLLITDDPLETLAPALDLALWTPRTRRVPVRDPAQGFELMPLAGASTAGAELAAACAARILAADTPIARPLPERLGDAVTLVNARAPVDYAAAAQRAMKSAQPTEDQLRRRRDALLEASGPHAWRTAANNAARAAMGIGLDDPSADPRSLTSRAIRSRSHPTAHAGGS